MRFEAQDFVLISQQFEEPLRTKVFILIREFINSCNSLVLPLREDELVSWTHERREKVGRDQRRNVAFPEMRFLFKGRRKSVCIYYCETR
ncbi:hypothetical protein NPIL_21561 [Nephila pilipes]|uniref:Uncharacterized protein n=1 Tax=Nephila pilipes TaxID=299642 RepID=A0A8X6PZM5_NEPPI|nr:hypothetical protein NPIL_21561 [Nephila pilipes]